MVLAIFVIPLILFIASAVMHGLAMKSGQFTKTLAIMPGLALIFSAGGLLLCQAIIKSKIKDAMSTLADVSGNLSSLFGDSVSNSVSSMIKFQGEIGFWLLVIIAIVLVVEDLVLSSKEGAPGQMQKPDPFVEDAIYAQKRQVPRYLYRHQNARLQHGLTQMHLRIRFIQKLQAGQDHSHPIHQRREQRQ